MTLRMKRNSAEFASTTKTVTLAPRKKRRGQESRMALKVLIILLSLFASGLLVGNELAVAVFIHPVLYSVSDEAHVRVAKPLARRLGHSMPFWYAISLVFAILQMLIMRAEHAPTLGSVSSRPGLAAYCGAGLVDFVRPAGSARPVLASADTAQRNSLPPKVLFLCRNRLSSPVTPIEAA